MRIRWWVITILVLSLVASLATGSIMLWRLFIFLTALLIMSYVWMRINLRHIDGRVVRLSPYCQVGDRFEEEITFTNTGKLPTALIEVKENADFPGYKSTATFHLPAQGTYSWHSEGVCRRRGLYDMGKLIVKITDPLGFFTVKEKIFDSKSITVFPTTIDLPFFQVIPRQEVGPSKRRWFTAEPGTNAARVRDYISGDNFRNIHWHTTAHTGNLMVKEFDPERAVVAYKDIWVVLDMQEATHCGEGDETTVEYAANMAASLVKKYVGEGKKVGLMASGERTYLFIPEASEEHLEKLMTALAVVKADTNLSLDGLIEAQEDRFEPGSAVVVISASSNLQAPLRRLVSRGAQVTAVLLDGLSFGGQTSAVDTARNLVMGGIHSYIVRRGAQISKALDSRYLLNPIGYSGMVR
ncbi:MAG: DUF58 domain-containing protein [Dehalococcoidales bacterium]|nr:DUF58 domain-containing protein [Dehalococcoidales bacterium]